MEVTCYVGIDVAKDRLDVHLRPLAKTIAVANDEEGMGQLLDILSPLLIERAVLEASGGHEKAAFLALVAAGHAVSIVNPRQVRDFAKGAARIARTDTIDAQRLPISLTCFVRGRHGRLPKSNVKLPSTRCADVTSFGG